MIVWTEETDALIKRRYIIDGAPAATVAKEVGQGCTPSMVRGRAKRIGVAKGAAPAVGPLPPRDGWKPAKPDKPGPKARVLADLPAHACKWAVGKDPGSGRMHLQLFCGEPSAEGSCYCATHAKRS